MSCQMQYRPLRQTFRYVWDCVVVLEPKAASRDAIIGQTTETPGYARYGKCAGSREESATVHTNS